MLWIEWIRISFISTAERHNWETTFNQIKQILEDEELVAIELLLNSSSETDVGVVLAWDTPMPKAKKSTLSITLSAILEEFGVTQRSSWFIITKKNTGPSQPQEDKAT